MVVSACSLLTSVDGLSGGDGSPAADASSSGDAGALDSCASDATQAADSVTTTDAADPRFDAYGKAVLADTPLAYWRFEETSPPTAKDERGLHDAVYTLAPSLGEPGIAGGRAVRFPAGQHAHVTQSSAAFNFPGKAPYAFEMWVKLSKLVNYQWLGGTEAMTDPRSGWSVWTDATGGAGYEVWGAAFTDGGSTQRRGVVAPPSLIVPGQFQHVVASYNGASMQVWIDGVKRVAANDTTDAPDTGPLMLGCRRASLPYQCIDDGLIDEVAIYDHALLDTRIVAHYTLGKP